MHGVRPDQVVATGAPVYDQWFARRPSTTREEFCRKVGLPADGRSSCISARRSSSRPTKSEFIDRWVRAVRPAPDPRVRAGRRS